MPPERSLEARFILARIYIDGDCWRWAGNLNHSGYGRCSPAFAGGRTIKAHRLSYETFVGPIPEGLTIDHLCAVRDCVNPEHLEPVTNPENRRRGAERRIAERRAKLETIARESGLDRLTVAPRTGQK